MLGRELGTLVLGVLVGWWVALRWRLLLRWRSSILLLLLLWRWALVLLGPRCLRLLMQRSLL